jgi:hypothetical protein
MDIIELDKLDELQIENELKAEMDKIADTFAIEDNVSIGIV